MSTLFWEDPWVRGMLTFWFMWMSVNVKTETLKLAFPAMRSVCVPFSLRPFEITALSCWVFLLGFFFFLVPPTRLYIWSSFSFSLRCYVTINLPPGTWRPLAPQRIWRTFCEQSHSLPHFSLSHMTKQAFVFLSHFGPPSKTVSQLFASSRLLFARELTQNLPKQ